LILTVTTRYRRQAARGRAELIAFATRGAKRFSVGRPEVEVEDSRLKVPRALSDKKHHRRRSLLARVLCPLMRFNFISAANVRTRLPLTSSSRLVPLRWSQRARWRESVFIHAVNRTWQGKRMSLRVIITRELHRYERSANTEGSVVAIRRDDPSIPAIACDRTFQRSRGLPRCTTSFNARSCARSFALEPSRMRQRTAGPLFCVLRTRDPQPSDCSSPSPRVPKRLKLCQTWNHAGEPRSPSLKSVRH